MENKSIYHDSTPVRLHRLVAVLDAYKSSLDNFRVIQKFVDKMPVEEKVEMLMTLAAYCRAELNGE